MSSMHQSYSWLSCYSLNIFNSSQMRVFTLAVPFQHPCHGYCPLLIYCPLVHLFTIFPYSSPQFSSNSLCCFISFTALTLIWKHKIYFCLLICFSFFLKNTNFKEPGTASMHTEKGPTQQMLNKYLLNGASVKITTVQNISIGILFRLTVWVL